MHIRRPFVIMAVLGLAAGGLPPLAKAADPVCPWVGSEAPIPQRVDQVLAAMTPAEKLNMVHGSAGPFDLAGPVYAGLVQPIPRLCVPRLGLSDGSAGIGNGQTGVTQLPSPTAMAAGWNRSLAAAYGDVLGAEVRGKGANVALAPAIDVARDPRAGRSYETFGEDPELTGELAVAQIRAIQQHGVIAQAKHLAAYSQETLRNTSLGNVTVDERTLQEIYLPAFERAVRDGGVGSVMCGYNYLNGVHACNNTYLLSQVLKGQFGFDGFVTSDWYGMTASVAAANAGLDLQMPDGCYFGKRLAPGARLDDMVRRILGQMFRLGLFDRPATGSPSAVVTTPRHAAIAREVAEQGTVLLKNADDVLPLRRSDSVAVIGTAAGAGVLGSGGGSAHVVAQAIDTPYDGIAAHGKVSFDDGTDPNRAARVAAASDVAVVFAAKWSTESKDAPDISLADNALIDKVAAANPNIVVVLNTGGPVTMPWLARVKGVLAAWYPGQEYGEALASLLYGDVNPSGKLPVTFPASLGQVPARAFPDGRFTEGLAVGYRWYDQQGLNPLFPFGFGLSYTRFELSSLRISGDVVEASVTNTGSRPGAEVVQLYVSHPASDREPPRQLKGFEKVFLAPGETQRVRFSLTPRDLSHWDSSAHQWVRTAGYYGISVGTSSRDLPLTGHLSVPRAVTSAPTPPPPPGAPSGGDSVGDALANVLTCPSAAAYSALLGAVSLVGLPRAAQAVIPPMNPLPALFPN
ncbi:beta-glucosidase [Amycolatopsis xylanica]|uniref:Exo-alpha-(1->6)-L-arabinopyranosidase n=1 Tax=Amycolatopsis xylanica TaxID=589385 RepID=A0A1H3SQ10_9PSEU|nr:glycoside hydrolase family 3 C-terminal domain-containing protein [Amycolatopsis xylanica]SDZ40014.1 beta-glucosidase [Amycolatopsis xylanica]